MAVADGVRSCLGRSMSCVWQSMSSAPPGPFPLSAMLAVGIAIAGVAVASVAVDDANELLGKGNMVSVIAIVSMAVVMVTPLLVAVYGLYCRCIFLRDLPTEDEKQEARESRGRLGRVLSCTRGCAYSIAVFLLHLLTIASLAISVALVLIMGTGFIVSLAGDEGCSQAKQKPQPAPVEPVLETLKDCNFTKECNFTVADVCDTLYDNNVTDITENCNVVAGGLKVADEILGTWPFNVKREICVPLFNGNDTEIQSWLVANDEHVNMTVQEYKTSVVTSVIDVAQMSDVLVKVADDVAILLQTLRIIKTISKVGEPTCIDIRDLSGPFVLLMAAAAILILAGSIARTVMVRYDRFISFWTRNTTGCAPFDSLIGLSILADERQEENNQRWLARYPEARDLAFDLVPVTFAFSILVGACVAVAVCITLYGGGTRKLLKQDQPFCPRCTKQGGRCGQCCSLTTAREAVARSLQIGLCLAIIVMIISSLALALAFGGSLTGGAAMTGSDVFLNVLVPPPLKEFYNKAANGTLTSAEVCNAYDTIVEGGSDADGMKGCATTTFVISMVQYMADQPPLDTGLDTHNYTLDCKAVKKMLDQADVVCTNLTAAAAGLASDAVKTAGSDTLLETFLDVYVQAVKVAQKIRDIGERVKLLSNDIKTPFLYMLGGAVAMVVGIALAYMAYSRYRMLEKVYETKAKRRSSMRGSSVKPRPSDGYGGAGVAYSGCDGMYNHHGPAQVI
ncbi:hypothetical protein EMIHUDRAFT_202759 [Emiliania huxleyi CCMP1516]|uniref:H(+)-exporting diphosphatase n=2 Tax=Emiliania huxleyi TaxID=2903 RepID=A0A0D3K8R3_EMIH1|nr:hypothetical protein EMIHUDRAFT_202759 [Emiliania huxleyi CCMP1516]EOD32148.1 hypothetical protein EMIHUDRAFT_202759 [Emiliania huxleyi CCMP1516]|eukprot:XP_005784577.1 hypothetical protein EMIHUDRAFT_202759 [Emiliania huxleyi CCMP1516]